MNPSALVMSRPLPRVRVQVAAAAAAIVGAVVVPQLFHAGGALLGGSFPGSASVWAATIAGIPGLCLQWILVPLAIGCANRLSRDRGEDGVVDA